MPSEKSDQGRFRTHAEVAHMVERIKTIMKDIPEEKGYKAILSGFITDLVSYPDVRQVYDETKEWIMHKPDLLEDYLLGMQSLIQFVQDVKLDGILFFADDVYKEDCPIAQRITEKYHVWKGSKAIYWLAYLISIGAVEKRGATYFREPALKENEFVY